MAHFIGQLLQFVGAGMVLAAFIAVRAGKLSHDSLFALLLNFAGSAILATLAIWERQWGFLLLEGAWAVVSLQGVVAYWRSNRVVAQKR